VLFLYFYANDVRIRWWDGDSLSAEAGDDKLQN